MEHFRLKKNLDEVIHERLMSSIFEGKFRSGEIISIERLCEQYSISRTPVIQAVKRLAADGIVDISPTGKFYFPTVDEETIRNIMEVRLLFETTAADKICDGPYTIVSSQLVRCAKTCTKYQEEGNTYMASMADMEFHRTLVDGVKNPYMTELFQRIQNKCLTLNYLNLNGESVVSPPAIVHHGQICDAMRAGDREHLSAVIKEHILFVEQQIISNIAPQQTQA